MKSSFLLMVLAGCASAQIADTVQFKDTRTAINAQLATKPARFFGTAAPGSVSGNLPGDMYTDTTNHHVYVCNAPSGTTAPACTSVTTAGWLQVDGASASTKTYNFQGVTHGGVSDWTINYAALTNYTFGAVDATHIRPTLVVAANSTGSAMWSVTPVTSTNPSVVFRADTRSTDAVNSGSIALSYACVTPGSSVDNPTPAALTALSLPLYESTQSVTCAGTTTSPADLYVWWTPTAPSGGTLTLLRLALTY